MFVPQNISLPMLKFPLADCLEIDEWTPKSFQSSLASKSEVVDSGGCYTTFNFKMFLLDHVHLVQANCRDVEAQQDRPLHVRSLRDALRVQLHLQEGV